jgi:hypothetical protein
MYIKSRGLIAIAALISSLVAGLIVSTPTASQATTAPPLPQNDSFYRAPAGWTRTAPGSILRWRAVQVAAFGALPLKVSAWQILYRSTGDSGSPIAAVTTVIRPSSTRPSGLISYQLAEDATASKCAPSYILRLGGGEAVGSVLSQAEILMIAAALGDGRAVSVPDWEGPHGSLFAPKEAGYVALDGVRAAERFTRLGLRGRTTSVAAWGYSGGGFATSWVADVQPRYAPDVRLLGAAIGAPITAVEKAVAAINGGSFSGFYPSILPGMLRNNQALRSAFDEHLTAAGQALLADGATHCLVTNIALHSGINMSHYLNIPFSTLLAQPAVRAAFRAMNPVGRPTAPLFVYQAVHDELVADADTAAAVRRWCAAGTSVDFLQDGLSEHGSLMLTGGPVALHWLNARIHGTAQRGCRTSTATSTLLTSASLATLPTYIASDLQAFVGLPPAALGTV